MKVLFLIFKVSISRIHFVIIYYQIVPMELAHTTLMLNMIGQLDNGSRFPFYLGQDEKLLLPNGKRNLTIQVGFRYQNTVKSFLAEGVFHNHTNVTSSDRMRAILSATTCIRNPRKESPYPFVEDLLFFKFFTKVFSNGTLRNEYLRACFRSRKFKNFGIWCDGSMKMHFVLDKFDAIKHCNNLNSSICKLFLLNEYIWNSNIVKDSQTYIGKNVSLPI